MLSLTFFQIDSAFGTVPDLLGIVPDTILSEVTIPPLGVFGMLPKDARPSLPKGP